MKIHDVDQASPEWYALRLGIPTASRFDEIITPKTGQFSKSSRAYMFRLIAEKLLNQSLDNLDNLEWVERGKELEPQAVRMYEFEREIKTRSVGFITSNDGEMGASPDRLIVGENGGLEIKCPAPQTHVQYMVDGLGDKYKVQVQGQIYVAELEYVDRYSFHPSMPPVFIRTYRDDAYIDLLAAALRQFIDEKNEILERVKVAGMFAERTQIMTPIDALADIVGSQPGYPICAG